MRVVRVGWVAACLAAVAVDSGCGGRKVYPDSLKGSFAMMEGSINDICQNLLDTKSATGDLGSDSDRVGWALAAFVKNAEGTDLQADAEKIRDRMAELDKMAVSKAPLDKQREVAKDLQTAMAALKQKL